MCGEEKIIIIWWKKVAFVQVGLSSGVNYILGNLSALYMSNAPINKVQTGVKENYLFLCNYSNNAEVTPVTNQIYSAGFPNNSRFVLVCVLLNV